MNKHTFELELVQLEEFFSKCRSNIYSDKRKDVFFNELYSVFESIVKTNYLTFSLPEYEDHRQIFSFLFNGLEFLDTSTLNVIPFELVFCLNKALNDWTKSDDLIIVTSLSNRREDIWFQGWNEESINNIKQLIKAKYSVNISKRLIRISLPKSLSRDYLSSVVLYHELGHFIDLELNIIDRIYYDKYKKWVLSSNEEEIFYNHFKEYFADLFAAQYINDSSNHYLNHLAYNFEDSKSHPATSKRSLVVENFLNGVSSREIDIIQEGLRKMGLPELNIRHNLINHTKSDFKDLVPQTINNDFELHSIFKLGWDLWLNSENNFLNDFSRRQKYHIINNLMEKSISNYKILESWKLIKNENIQ